MASDARLQHDLLVAREFIGEVRRWCLSVTQQMSGYDAAKVSAVAAVLAEIAQKATDVLDRTRLDDGE